MKAPYWKLWLAIKLILCIHSQIMSKYLNIYPIILFLFFCLCIQSFAEPCCFSFIITRGSASLFPFPNVYYNVNWDSALLCLGQWLSSAIHSFPILLSTGSKLSSQSIALIFTVPMFKLCHVSSPDFVCHLV